MFGFFEQVAGHVVEIAAARTSLDGMPR